MNIYLLAAVELIKSLPVIIETLMKLKRLWDQSFELAQRQAKMKELGHAIDKATEKKDTSDLESFFRNLSK